MFEWRKRMSANRPNIKVGVKRVGLIAYDSKKSVINSATEILRDQKDISLIQANSVFALQPFAAIRLFTNELEKFGVILQFHFQWGGKTIWSVLQALPAERMVISRPDYMFEIKNALDISGNWKIIVEAAFVDRSYVKALNANGVRKLRFTSLAELGFTISPLTLTETGARKDTKYMPRADVAVNLNDI